MKIRTDFVTNSSSSSFVVEVEVELVDNSRFVFETKPTDDGANSNFKCTGDDIVKADNVNTLCNLLQKSMTGTGKTKIKNFTKELQTNIDDISSVSSVTMRRIWISMGESSGCTIINDSVLQELARKVVTTKGADKDAACEELENHLKNEAVYCEGGWQDSWPTGFCGSKAIPHYKWAYLNFDIPKLAKRIADGKIDNNDLAVEMIHVDMQDKTIAESADFIVDSKWQGIGIKPACKSTAFFGNTIKNAFPEYELKSQVSVNELVPDFTAEVDLIDYVIFSNGVAKAAILIKTAVNSRSKTFKDSLI